MKFPEIDTHIAWVACASIGLIAAFIVLIVIVGGVRKERHEQCRQAHAESTCDLHKPKEEPET